MNSYLENGVGVDSNHLRVLHLNLSERNKKSPQELGSGQQCSSVIILRTLLVVSAKWHTCHKHHVDPSKGFKTNFLSLHFLQ
jgi:hypothetical protein